MRLRAASILVFAALAGGCDAPSEVGQSTQELTVCADGATIRGIDVSQWQGTIDWDAVAAAGVKYAFIRLNHGLTNLDSKFEFNWSEAKRVGIVRGVYQFYAPGESTTAQAQLLLDKMGPLDAADLPPVLDVEQSGSKTPAQMTDAIAIWIDHVTAATGRKPIIYTSPSFWQSKVGAPSDFVANPLWIAHYNVMCPTIADPWPRWDFWQKSSTGTIAGISGPVDLDDFNGDAAALQSFVASTQLCGDGRCLPGERQSSCAADCGACVLPRDGGELDDAGACFTVLGRPASWRTEQVGAKGSLHWTYAWDQPDENVGTWTFELAEAGRYHVEVHTPSPYGGTHAASYHVRHAGIDEIVKIDQSAVDGWQTLGDWDFAAGGDQRIWLGDSTGEPFADRRRIVFDSVRLSRLPDPVEADGGSGGGEVDGGAEPGPDAGEPIVGEDRGCAMTPRGVTAPWALLLVLALVVRRRRA